MKMRPGSPPRASAQPNQLSLFDLVAFLNQKFRQVQVERQQSLAVVNHHAVPLIEEQPCEDHLAAIDRGNRSSRRHAEVEPLMRGLHRTVKHALDPEHLGNLSLDRRSERTAPLALGAQSLEGLFLGLMILIDLALIVRARRGVASRNLENHARIAPMLNRNLPRERDRLSGGRFSLELHWISTRFGLETRSRKCNPRLRALV